MKAGKEGFIPSGCGIVGAHEVETTPRVLETMRDSLSHRGPDGAQSWTSADKSTQFAHRRLAIVGIDERGAQPMSRGPHTVTFNGEIYNYPELKRELQQRGYEFTSESDTEAILHAYKEWGPDCVKKFNGIFAFGLYDEERQQLMLARDHVGVKPLVYNTPDSKGILFASEPKAVLHHPQVSKQPDFDTIRADMVHGFWGPKQGTWFKDVLNLDPGSYMLVDTKTGENKTERYWEPQVKSADLFDEREVTQQFKEIFEDAVKLQLLSDVGVSTTNSGGIDSSAITAVAAKHINGVLQAITIEYDDADTLVLGDRPPEFTDGTPRRLVDLWHARKLAQGIPNVELTGVKVPQVSFDREKIDDIVQAMDQMPMDMRMLSIDFMYKKIRELGHKVVLIGQGPDEIWMGYYYDDDFWRFPPEKTSAAYLANEYYPNRIPFGKDAWNPDFLNPSIARDLSQDNLQKNYQRFQTDDPINNLTFYAMNTMLQSVLHLEDRMSMSNSVEARVPWLDHRLVDLSFRVPGYLKINAPDDNKAKWINRQALRGVVPDHIIDRRKSPFPHPPDEYRDKMVELLKGSGEGIKKSPFMKHMLTDNFLRTLDTNPELGSRDLFQIYSMWRFGEVNGF
jgi:asparagine synthase (glutamine-hydrolysing)